MRVFLTLAAVFLAGCQGPEVLRGSGQPADPPGGFVDYCIRHPDRAECGGSK